jgi:hypothetical protein
MRSARFSLCQLPVFEGDQNFSSYHIINKIMPPIPVFSIPNRQSFGMEQERSISSNSMESYLTNIMASSFRGKNILSPSSPSNIRCKKDDDEYDTSSMMMMMYTDDSSLSDNGSDSGNHSGHKSTNSSETFHGQQRGFYDMIDDRYSHRTVVASQPVGDFDVATTCMDDRCEERPSSQRPLPNEDNFKNNDDDDVFDTVSSKVNSGSPSSVFASKKSVSRMLKVTTQRLTKVSKVKLE